MTTHTRSTRVAKPHQDVGVARGTSRSTISVQALADRCGVSVAELPALLEILWLASGVTFEWSPDRKTIRAWGIEQLTGRAPTSPRPPWW